MKVIYYRRHVKSGFHIHAFSSADIFYIPNEEAILYMEQLGSFGGRVYSFTERKELLDEAKSVMRGSEIEGVEISNVKEFEYDRVRIKQLIKDARLKSELETEVHSGIEEILEQIE